MNRSGNRGESDAVLRLTGARQTVTPEPDAAGVRIFHGQSQHLFGNETGHHRDMPLFFRQLRHSPHGILKQITQHPAVIRDIHIDLLRKLQRPGNRRILCLCHVVIIRGKRIDGRMSAIGKIRHVVQRI